MQALRRSLQHESPQELPSEAPGCGSPGQARSQRWHAGALALMQEVGAADVVRRWAAAWLADNARDPAAQDVALTLALALSDAASAALAAGDSLRAASLLEEGLAVLHANAAAPELAREIAGALEVVLPGPALH